MLKLLLLLSALMGLPLIFGERTACVESQPQSMEQVWSAADETLWDQIATGKLGLMKWLGLFGQVNRFYKWMTAGFTPQPGLVGAG